MKLTKILLMVSLLFVVSSGYAWWNTSWTRRMPLNISHTEAVSDYSVLFQVSKLTEMQDDFDDIRIIASDDTTELPYYKQYVSTGVYAWFYVKMNVSNGNETVYLYYGNAGASDNSDFNNAFLYADDFNNGLGSIWNGTANSSSCHYEVNNSELLMSCNDTGVWNYSEVSNTRVWIDDAIDNSVEWEMYVEIVNDSNFGTTSYAGLTGMTDFTQYHDENSSNRGIYSETGNLLSVIKGYVGRVDAVSRYALSQSSRHVCIVIRHFPDTASDYWRVMWGSSILNCQNPSTNYATGSYVQHSHTINDLGLYFSQFTNSSESDSVRFDNFYVRKINGVYASQKYLVEEPVTYFGTPEDPCGDSICQITENCNSCSSDCGCITNYQCAYWDGSWQCVHDYFVTGTDLGQFLATTETPMIAFVYALILVVLFASFIGAIIYFITSQIKKGGGLKK